jgi:hypothetical protein
MQALFYPRTRPPGYCWNGQEDVQGAKDAYQKAVDIPPNTLRGVPQDPAVTQHRSGLRHRAGLFGGTCPLDR